MESQEYKKSWKPYLTTISKKQNHKKVLTIKYQGVNINIPTVLTNIVQFKKEIYKKTRIHKKLEFVRKLKSMYI